MDQSTDTTTDIPADDRPVDRVPTPPAPPASPVAAPADPAVPAAAGSQAGGGRVYPATPTAGPGRGAGFRLRRSRTERMLGGVCGGLAESIGVDVTLIRIGLVALTVLGAGIGVVLYLAAWILAPEA